VVRRVTGAPGSNVHRAMHARGQGRAER